MSAFFFPECPERSQFEYIRPSLKLTNKSGDETVDAHSIKILRSDSYMRKLRNSYMNADSIPAPTVI